MSRGTILLNEEKYLFSQKTLIGGNGAFIASFKNSNEFFGFFFLFCLRIIIWKKKSDIKYWNELRTKYFEFQIIIFVIYVCLNNHSKISFLYHQKRKYSLVFFCIFLFCRKDRSKKQNLNSNKTWIDLPIHFSRK